MQEAGNDPLSSVPGFLRPEAPTAIKAEMWPEEATRTPSKSCFYIATCTVEGTTYTARSRSGAALELARVLVAAGIPDCEMRVRQKGHKGDLIYRSFHAAAAWTIEENSRGMSRVSFARLEAKREQLRSGTTFGQKQAGNDSDGVKVGSALQVDKSPDAVLQDEVTA